MLLGVYGPIQNREREDFSGELCSITGLWNDLSCIDKDFSVVCIHEERRNHLRSSVAMRHSSIFIEEIHLRDLPLTEEWKNHFSGLIQ